MAVKTLPWYAEVSRDQWRAFFAVFLGWVVDAFDFNIITFILIDIEKSFTIDRAISVRDTRAAPTGPLPSASTSPAAAESSQPKPTSARIWWRRTCW